MDKLCLYCNHPIKGRADKKFCDDNCRNIYNNQQNSDTTNLMRNVNNALRRNRRILLELNPDGKTKITKSKLVEKGFQFSYHTSTKTTKSGATCFFCYDYGYQPLENDAFLIVSSKEKE